MRLERSVALLVRLVMDDRTVSAISCNSGKTRLLKAWLFSTEGGELTVNVHFRNRRPCLHLFVQPTQEAYHGYTVVEHSLTEAFHFGLVLLSAPTGHGVFKRAVVDRCQSEWTIAEAHLWHTQEGNYIRVGRNRYVSLAQLGDSLWRHRIVVGEEREVVKTAVVNEVAQEYGIVCDVSTTKVEQPSDVRQVVEDEHIVLARVGTGQFLFQSLQFRLDVAARVACVLGHDRSSG